MQKMLNEKVCAVVKERHIKHKNRVKINFPRKTHKWESGRESSMYDIVNQKNLILILFFESEDQTHKSRSDKITRFSKHLQISLNVSSLKSVIKRLRLANQFRQDPGQKCESNCC